MPVTWSDEKLILLYCPGRGSNSRPPAHRSFKHGQGVLRPYPLGHRNFTYYIVLCGGDETDTTEYLETWRRALEESGMRISRRKTQFIDFKFGQDNGQGRESVNILGEEL